MKFDFRCINFQHLKKLKKEFFKAESLVAGFEIASIVRIPKENAVADNKENRESADHLLQFLEGAKDFCTYNIKDGEIDFEFCKGDERFYLSNIKNKDGSIEKVLFQVVYANCSINRLSIANFNTGRRYKKNEV